MYSSTLEHEKAEESPKRLKIFKVGETRRCWPTEGGEGEGGGGFRGRKTKIND